ncbi:hypothetical protein H5J25_16375 [Sphingomonas aliaeris]|uniref:Uncharacterized protein n=2 Tax=Sphingomonas aliaeris TaxID=2759526 RepID=A0A974S650_9SPHN|nr:hypothetical protein H5J25_16375 [Sphingomonas aliaeris]
MERKRWVLRAGLALTIGLLLFNVAKLLVAAWLALDYAYDLDYGEGIVWQQMRNMLAGTGYAPLRTYPAIVYHYPPVYHLTTAALAWAAGIDELLAGRLVSLLSTFASMLFVGMLTYSAVSKDESTVVRWLSAGVAAACLAMNSTIVEWAVLMRVDMLGCALTLGGLVLSVRAFTRPTLVPLAALVFVLAVYTKQTNIAGPAAAFVALWFIRPRSALALLGWCAGLGLIALAVLTLTTEGGFLRHILFYNVNRLDWKRWQLLMEVMPSQAPLIAAACFAIYAAWRRLAEGGYAALRTRTGGDETNATLLLLLSFVAVKTAMLPMILKSGSSTNYLIEWSCGIATLAGLAAVPVLRVAHRGDAWPSPILVACLTIALPISAWWTPAVNIDRPALRARDVRMAGIVNRIRASAKPVVTDDMVLLIRAGRPVEYEPAIAAELGYSGVYDEAGFVAKIRRGDFGFFLTRGDRSSRLFNERYNPRVADAIDAVYPLKERDGDLVFHLPSR